MRPLQRTKFHSIYLVVLALLLSLGASLYAATPDNTAQAIPADTLLPPMSVIPFITTDGHAIAAPKTPEVNPARELARFQAQLLPTGQLGCRYTACEQYPEGCGCDGFWCGDVFICGIPCDPHTICRNESVPSVDSKATAH
jgi:hypothetical protein